MAVNLQTPSYIIEDISNPVYVFDTVEMLDNLLEDFGNRRELIDAGILEDIQILANDIAELPDIYNIVQLINLIELLANQINVMEIDIQAIQNTINNIWQMARTPQVIIVNYMMNVIDYPSDIEQIFNQKSVFSEVIESELPVMFDFSSENSLFVKLTLVG